MTQRGIVDWQLSKGDKSAMEYFINRVDLMLAAGPSDDLYRFMKKFWPAFKLGLDGQKEAKDG